MSNPQTANSFREFIETSDYAAFPRNHRTAGFERLDMIEIRQTPHQMKDAAVPEFVLQFVLKADMEFRWDLEGKYWSRSQRSQTGVFCLAPPETAIAYSCPGPHDLLLLSLPKDHLQLATADTGLDLAQLNSLCGPLFSDVRLRRDLLALWKTAGTTAPTSILRSEALQLLVIERLLALADAENTHRSPGLSDSELQQIIKLIGDYEYEPPTLASIASELGWPQLKLKHAISSKTGKTLYQLVLDARIERARDKLLNSNEPIAQIAYACGFSSQQHMTNTFTSKLGVSPARYRRETDG